jgi:hypothetical protein
MKRTKQRWKGGTAEKEANWEEVHIAVISVNEADF